MMRWTDDALDAAISQLKALRFSQGMSLREQMTLVLNAAWREQLSGLDLIELEKEIAALCETIKSLPGSEYRNA